MKNKTYLLCTALLLAACSFFGCNDDESIAPENEIGVSVTAETLATKGSAITLTSLSQFGVDGFLMTAIAGKDTHYVNNGEVSKTSTGWSPIYKSGTTTPYTWASSAIAFWARAPYTQTVTFADDYGTMSFDYTLPAHTSDNADATLQQDIVAAYTKVSYADTEASSYTAGKGKVNFTFGHALAGIRFDVTDLEEGWTLQAVKLSGIYAGGTCTVTPATSGAPTFAWSLGTTTGTYVQTLASTDFGAETIGGVNRTAVLKENTGKVFFIPPQTFPEGAEATLTLKKGTRTVDVSASIAGQEATISNMHTFQVSVADRFQSITLNGVALAWTEKDVTVATDNTPQASQFAVTGEGIQNVYEQHKVEDNKPYRQTWVIGDNTATVSFKVFSPVEGTYELKPFVKKGDDGTIVEETEGFLVTFLTGNNDGTGTIGDPVTHLHEATKVEFTVAKGTAADDDQLFFKTYVIDTNGMRQSLDSETQLYDMRGYHYFMVNDPLN